MRWYWMTLLGAAVMLGCQQRPLREPTVADQGKAEQPATMQADAARVMEVVEETSPSDAISNLAVLLSRNARNVAYLQQLTQLAQQRLTAQLRVLTAGNDPEGMARAVRVLSFTDALSRFLADTLAAGDGPEQADLVAWALEPEHALLVAAAYDREGAQRAAAAGPLAKLPGKHADAILARLIDDREREVSLAAMDACYDRPATRAVVDALWNKVIVLGLRSMGARMDFTGEGRGAAARTEGPRQIVFRGRVLQDYGYHVQLSLRAADADVATDLLLYYKSDLVKSRVAQLFEMLARTPGNAQVIRYLLSSRYGTISMHALRLIQAYRPPNAIPVMLAFIDGSGNDGHEQNVNGQVCYFSTRAELIGFIVGMADLDRETYHVMQMQNWGASWVINGTAKEEADAVAKLRAWWKTNYKNFGATSPEIGEPIPLEGGSGRWRSRF